MYTLIKYFLSLEFQVPLAMLEHGVWNRVTRQWSLTNMIFMRRHSRVFIQVILVRRDYLLRKLMNIARYRV